MQQLSIENIYDCKIKVNLMGSNPTSITAWELSSYVDGLDEVNCKDGLQFLTTMEADITLIDWFKSLRVGGSLSIEVPDADYYARMWLSAEWNEVQLNNKESDARSSFSGLFGQQKNANPVFDNYNNAYSDVYKSAYNSNRLSFILERTGFVNVEVKVDGVGKLIAFAQKTMEKGERQVSKNYDNIRADHKNRYTFACNVLEHMKCEKILDLACGIGYGSLMLNKATSAQVIGVDIDTGAIDYAEQYYSAGDVEFLCEDAQKLTLEAGEFDAVVSFETIEHVTFDLELLNTFYKFLKPEGIFICSTPNEDIMSFDKDKFPFHIKHYTNSELVDMLAKVGFKDIKLYTQKDPVNGEVIPGDGGCFTIAVATRQ